MSDTLTEDAARPTVRRTRGQLEALVREVCDIVVAGGISLQPGQTWTPHQLGKEIVKRWPASGVKPSPGAIADTLRRWADIGFAEIVDKPLSFSGYTPAAAELGLEALKEVSRLAKLEERRKEREALTPDATVEATEEASEVETIPDEHEIVLSPEDIAELEALEALAPLDESAASEPTPW
jgi:hypothetical protein